MISISRTAEVKHGNTAQGRLGLAVLIAAGVLLSGCEQKAPASQTCDDFRVITGYRSVTVPPQDNYIWTGPENFSVCVIAEQKTPRPK